MQEFPLLPHALLSGAIGTILSFQPIQNACFPVGDLIPVDGRQEATQVLGQASAQFKDLDDVYHSLVKSYEISAAQWRQRPGDLVALRSDLAALRKEITTLCELSEKVERPSTAPVAKGATKESTTPAPSGPVRPSQAPSPDEEVQKRRKATEERFLSVPVEDSPETRTLVGVPKSWIKMSCVRAHEELDKI